MNEIMIGDKAPDFTTQNEIGDDVSLGHFVGKKLILYFYPKDNTPGCTQEACDFRDLYSDITNKNAVVIGVSKDNASSHQSFISKQKLTFNLLTDPGLELIKAYGAWVEKSMFGKKYMGIERCTFLIDEKGYIENIWRKVKVKNHAQEVLEAI